MRAGLAVVAVSLVVASSAGAQLPAATALREAKLMQQIGLQTRAWIVQEAVNEAQTQAPTEAAAYAAVRAKAAMLGKLSGGDIDQLVFLVMMAAAKDAEDDLKTMLDEMDKLNQVKAAQARALPAGRAIGAAPVIGTKPVLSPSARLSVAPQPIQPRPIPRAEFDNRLAALVNDPAGLEAMRAREQTRLKLVTDRHGMALAALTNLMNRMSQTSASLTANLP